MLKGIIGTFKNVSKKSTMARFAFILILFPLTVFCQDNRAGGYANAGMSIFGTRNVEATVGAFLGFGIQTGSITSGFSLDIYQFNKEKMKYVILSGDFRAYVLGVDKPVSPFLSGQPGFVIYNKSIGGITTKGSFAYGINAGARIKPTKKFPGVIMSMGYENISFKTTGTSIGGPYRPAFGRSGGIKLNMGITI